EMGIGGFTEPRRSRTGLGALLLGVHEHGRLRYAGKVGTGFDERLLASLRKRLDRLEQPSSPFASRVRGEKGVHWVKPQLVGEIAFAGWTDDGLVRQARFTGLREDKPTREVVREKAKPAGKDNVVAGVTISHPERVLYPSLHATKLDLARYYEQVWRWLAPHLEDRPLGLLRCPRGPA